MVRSLKSTLLAGLFMVLGFGALTSAEYKLDESRSVIGAGGMVEQVSSKGNYTVSGILSQAVIDDRSSNAYLLKQGFWVAVPESTSVVSDYEIKSNGITNFPNPVSDYTKIQFELPSDAYVTVKMYDVTGNLVSVVYDNYANAGNQSMNWYALDQSGTKLSSGNYVCEVSARPAVMAGGEGFQAFVSRKVITVVK